MLHSLRCAVRGQFILALVNIDGEDSAKVLLVGAVVRVAHWFLLVDRRSLTNTHPGLGTERAVLKQLTTTRHEKQTYSDNVPFHPILGKVALLQWAPHFVFVGEHAIDPRRPEDIAKAGTRYFGPGDNGSGTVDLDGAACPAAEDSL